MHKQQRSVIPFLCAMLCGLLGAQHALAANYYVAAGGSIQSAVNGATDGDTVWLAAGTYNLNAGVDLGFRAISIRSQSGDATDTIVNGRNLYRCFHLRNGFAGVYGITIRNGKAPIGDNGYRYGGGVYCEGGGIVENCIVENCSADYGGGIRIHSLGQVDNSIIRNNTSTAGPGDGGGGGIHAYLTAVIQDCTIYGNTAADSGGGVKLSHGGSMTRCTVYGNTAARYGGGIYCYEGGDVSECNVYNNTANYGGGIRLIRETGTISKVSRCRIHGNATTSANGGGVHVAFNGTLENCLVYDNTAAANGGGVYLYQGGLIHSCTIAHNTTKDTDGNGVGDGLGGGIYTSGGGTIRNSIIFWNSSESTPNRNTAESSVRYEYTLTYPTPTGTGNIFGTPGFVDLPSRNYYLKSDSVCRDAGGTTAAPGVDFVGAIRPLDGTGDGVQKYDIGAYEYQELDDVDGDGMPSYWEDLYGLDPNDPADGTRSNSVPPTVTDRDGDGLWNIEEYENGSNPIVQDTDGDGISDFAEVYGRYPVFGSGIITDPAQADSDGDGFNDRFEIDSDSDPNNPASYLVTLSGSVSYSGSVQTGRVVILVSNATVAARTADIAQPGAYVVTNLPTLEPLVVTAYRDSNGNSLYDSWEAYGEYVGNPLTMVGPAAGINVVLDDPTTDSDGDGLTDFFEVYTSLTLPGNRDTDSDGMWDGWEWDNGPAVNPADPAVDPLDGTDGTNDPDNDALSNLGEYAAHTDPNDPDSDGDLLPDGWESDYPGFTSPTNGLDAGWDLDLDTIANSNEYAYGTSPALADTDGDGMPDDWEIRYIAVVSPTNSDGLGDADSDLISNVDEYNQGSYPNDSDTDDDLMMDGWEFYYMSFLSSNELSIISGNDGANDPDNDGLTNFEEFMLWLTLPRPPGGGPFAYGPHPHIPDSDGDGVNDGDEVAAGSNPISADSYPVSISGQLEAYSGIQSGVCYVVASQSPTGLVYVSEGITNALTNAVSYVLSDVAILTNYYVHAFMDSTVVAKDAVSVSLAVPPGA